VFVYNTWGLDFAVRNEFSGLLSGRSHVGLVSVDESTRDSQETYRHVSFAIRVGFDAEKYRSVPNLLVAPLGVSKQFVEPSLCKPITERRFGWSFLGEIKNSGRQRMLAQLSAVDGLSFLHAISEWDGADSVRGRAYSDVLADSVFVPSPSANVHCECYRTYEALECDAIPVVPTTYYWDSFGAPFPIVEPDWSDAPRLINALLADDEALRRLHHACATWWSDVKMTFPEKVRTLAETGARSPPSVLT
jgi:hypothetical protein